MKTLLAGAFVSPPFNFFWYMQIQGWSYFLGQRFCVLYFEICTLPFPSLWSANFKTKHALNL